jgi:hypothetical protein
MMQFVTSLTPSGREMKQSAGSSASPHGVNRAISGERRDSSWHSGRAHHLVGSHAGVDSIEPRGARRALRERDGAAAADAIAERAQSVSGRGPVPRKPAVVAAGGRLELFAQRAVKVPSRWSSAFEVFCAAGSELLLVWPAAGAYG